MRVRVQSWPLRPKGSQNVFCSAHTKVLVRLSSGSPRTHWEILCTNLDFWLLKTDLVLLGPIPPVAATGGKEGADSFPSPPCLVLCSQVFLPACLHLCLLGQVPRLREVPNPRDLLKPYPLESLVGHSEMGAPAPQQPRWVLRPQSDKNPLLLASAGLFHWFGILFASFSISVNPFPIL